ncbi:MAG: glutamine amidotransferase-related protein [Pirellula sp.]
MQFHPESILTQHGYAILSNFLTQSGLKSASIPASDLS